MHGGDIYRNQVRLDFSVNVNPLGIPERVRTAMERAAGQCGCYPDIRYEGLKEGLSRMLGVRPEQILCGNGSSELFFAIVHALMPRKTVIPVPSFSGYEKAAGICGGQIAAYPMKEENDFTLDEGMLELLTEDTGLLFLADPNNPTGKRLEPGLLRRILEKCRANGIPVVLDECFIEFTEGWEQEELSRRVREYPDLIVVRAFTKIFSVPGVRLGYLVCGDPALLQRIGEHLPEWNLSVFAQAAGSAAVEETEYVKRTAGFVAGERAYLAEGLRALGWKVYPSQANFLLTRTEYDIGEEMLRRGILLRDCADFAGLGKGYYRIAVRQREENEELLRTLKEVIKEVTAKK